MGQQLWMALLLACSLGIGPLISTSHHTSSKTSGRVRATLSWTGDLRWQKPDDGGQRFKATLIGSAQMRITAPGIAPQLLSLSPFLLPGHAYTPVDGPSDGCGAPTNLAILPKAGSQLPYVAAFVVLAEKGCLAVPIVFVPMKSPHGYTYVGAPYYAMWWGEPKTLARIRAASIDRVTFPRAAVGSGVTTWPLLVVTNALPTGPRVAVFEPPAKHIHPGSAIMLGDGYTAWFGH